MGMGTGTYHSRMLAAAGIVHLNIAKRISVIMKELGLTQADIRHAIQQGLFELYDDSMCMPTAAWGEIKAAHRALHEEAHGRIDMRYVRLWEAHPQGVTQGIELSRLPVPVPELRKEAAKDESPYLVRSFFALSFNSRFTKLLEKFGSVPTEETNPPPPHRPTPSPPPTPRQQAPTSTKRATAKTKRSLNDHMLILWDGVNGQSGFSSEEGRQHLAHIRGSANQTAKMTAACEAGILRREQDGRSYRYFWQINPKTGDHIAQEDSPEQTA